MHYRFISTNGITLHCAVDGPEDGDLVVLLHGFPEFHAGMAGTMRALAAAGYRVVAPDQRGYNLSDKPRGTSAYDIDTLARDVLGLIDAFGAERAHVVGHDWGAAVTWWLALTSPHRLRRVVVANVPHPSVMSKQIRTDRDQRRKSWYIFAFQIPWLPEALASSTRLRAAFADRIATTSRPGAFSPEYLAALREAWSQPRAPHGMISWYRAAVQRRPDPPFDRRVRVPVLIIWGLHDIALSSKMIGPSAALCDDVRVITYDDATHWVLHDKPAETAAAITHFLAQG